MEAIAFSERNSRFPQLAESSQPYDRQDSEPEKSVEDEKFLQLFKKRDSDSMKMETETIMQSGDGLKKTANGNVT